MAEECKCIMSEVLKSMRSDIEKNEAKTTKTTESLQGLITTTALAKQVMDQVLKAQDVQNVTAERNQVAMVKSNDEIKDAQLAGFKAMKDERLEEKRVAQEKKEADEKVQEAEEKRLNEKQEDENKEATKWKKRLLIGLYVSIFLMALNFGMGVVVKYAPHQIGLPASNSSVK